MGKNIRVYMNDESEQILDTLEDDINEIYDNRAQFFQSQVKALDGKAVMEAKKNILQRKKESLQHEIEAIDAKIDGLEDRMEDIEDQDNTEVLGTGGESLEDKDQYHKAMDILERKWNENRGSLDTDMQAVRHWSQQLEVRPEDLISHVENRVVDE